jgi:hypothetical protein
MHRESAGGLGQHRAYIPAIRQNSVGLLRVPAVYPVLRFVGRDWFPDSATFNCPALGGRSSGFCGGKAASTKNP